LAIFALVTLFMGLLPTRAQAEGCRIVNAQTGCDVCKNNCCYAYNSHMESCRVIRRLCRLHGDLECPGYTLCVLEAQHDLDICNVLCQLDYPNCE
jgi:hypothetical protein